MASSSTSRTRSAKLGSSSPGRGFRSWMAWRTSGRSSTPSSRARSRAPSSEASSAGVFARGIPNAGGSTGAGWSRRTGARGAPASGTRLGATGARATPALARGGGSAAGASRRAWGSLRGRAAASGRRSGGGAQIDATAASAATAIPAIAHTRARIPSKQRPPSGRRRSGRPESHAAPGMSQAPPGLAPRTQAGSRLSAAPQAPLASGSLYAGQTPTRLASLQGWPGWLGGSPAAYCTISRPPADLRRAGRPVTRRARARPLIFLLFFASGSSGLVYELIWIREFGLLFGSTVYSAALVTSLFMCGLGAGSYLAGRWADRRYSADRSAPLRAYGLFELGIAVLALANLFAIPALAEISAAAASYERGPDGWYWRSTGGTQVRYAWAVLLTAPTTLLMGGTLTLLIRHLVGDDLADAGWHVGALYGVNTAGAALGCLLTDTALVPLLGLRGTQIVAVAARAC